MRTHEREDRRRAIAVLGGGISGLTAAYELSRTPELRRRYQVTVYEASHRLGGKLASGRNPDASLRNEEHGLHVWFGSYDNAFRLAREVFAAWRPPPGCPITSVEEAFLPQDFTPFGHTEGGSERLCVWDLSYGRDADAPGTGDVFPSLLGVLTRTLDGFLATLATQLSCLGVASSARIPRVAWRASDPATRHQLVAALSAPLRRLAGVLKQRAPTWRATQPDSVFLQNAARMARHAVLRAIDAAALPEFDLTLAGPMDFLLSALVGVFDPRYRVLEDGDLDRLNHLDLRDFLLEHGARATTAEGPLVRVLYDMSFQYEDGDASRPRFEAGTAFRIFLRLALTYKGAVIYLVRAGMGETLLGPVYEVLRQQGVRFAFHHRLDALELSPDRRRLEGLRLTRRTPVDAEEPAPTFVHRGLVCWRHEEPALARREEPVVLRRGTHFDDVILALPAGVIAGRHGTSPCEALLAAQPRLRALFQHINLVPTVAAQLWTDRDLAGLGWTRARPAVVGWGRPLDVWVDMTHTIEFEGWSSERPPRGAHYLCGVFPAGPLSAAREAVVAQLHRRAADQWWGARGADGTFDWRVLHDPSGGEGEARLDAQYLRVNVEPGDLCDASAPGTSRLRPEADESGLENLALAGTWVRTSLGTTCVETAVMAGMAAAHAVSGEGRAIIADGFLHRAPRRGVLSPARLAPPVGRTAPAPREESTHGR